MKDWLICCDEENYFIKASLVYMDAQTKSAEFRDTATGELVLVYFDKKNAYDFALAKGGSEVEVVIKRGGHGFFRGTIKFK